LIKISKFEELIFYSGLVIIKPIRIVIPIEIEIIIVFERNIQISTGYIIVQGVGVYSVVIPPNVTIAFSNHPKQFDNLIVYLCLSNYLIVPLEVSQIVRFVFVGNHILPHTVLQFTFVFLHAKFSVVARFVCSVATGADSTFSCQGIGF